MNLDPGKHFNMNAKLVYGANTYARVGLETGVVAATPHKLILMLFEGARLALSCALIHMKENRPAARGEALSRAIAIISSGLQASLDIERGGELAQQLNTLYAYMSHRLLQANLQNEARHVEEVARLLRELSEAWAGIGTVAQAAGGETGTPAMPQGSASFSGGM
ncbi:flagellar protein FliS [Nitrosovibrio sp. Nv17]|nr:flagellar protein FliS [Nitrosovibrio sp. Nv17]